MSKKIQLAIPKPCNQNWDTMTPVEKGRFCSSCQKKVIDFSSMSDRAIAQYFRKPSTGSVCGRFLIDQLEKELEIPRKRIPWVKYLFTVAIPAFLISARAKGEKTQGNIKLVTVPIEKTDTIVKPYTQQVVDNKPALVDESFTIDGLVTGSDRPLPGVAVRIKGKRTSVATGENGRFRLQVNLGETLVISCIGFQPEELVIRNIKDLHIILLPNNGTSLLGEVAYVEQADKKNVVVHGTVTDQDGNPLPGVTILVKGQRKAVLTGENGRFEIMARIGDSLQPSGAGIDAGTVAVKAKTGNDITVNYRFLGCKVEVVRMGQVRKKESDKYHSTPRLLTLAKDSIKRFFRINPNPVRKGDPVQFEIEELEEGYYTRQLMDLSGRLVKQDEIWIDREARILDWELPFVPAGTYLAVLVNKRTGKMQSQKMLIQ